MIVQRTSSKIKGGIAVAAIFFTTSRLHVKASRAADHRYRSAVDNGKDVPIRERAAGPKRPLAGPKRSPNCYLQ
jgi:hypothetical protein